MLRLSLFFLLFAFATLTAEPYPEQFFTGDQPVYCCELEKKDSWGNIFALGPEFYYVKRTRKGGTRQTGTPVGIRFNYDHIKRYKIYYGMQAFYGNGILKGRTGDEDKIRSRLTDEQVEGYLGYTFAYKYSPYFSFTPFIGGGYFRETNSFHPPTPIKVRMTTDFFYAAYGFLSSIKFNCWSLGLNARFRTPWDIKCKISDSEQDEKITQLVEDRLQYRIELPIGYSQSFLCNLFTLRLVPFYESRVYGGRENYPYDFFETTYRIYGANLQLVYEF